MHLNGIRGVCLHKENGEWQIEKSISNEITADTDPDTALMRCIDDLTQQAGKLAIVLPQHFYQLVQIDKPDMQDMQERDFQAALPWAIKEMVTLQPENIVADFIDNPVKVTSQPERISVFAANKELLQKLINDTRDHKAELDLITTEELMMCDLLGDEQAAHLMIFQERGLEPSIQIIREGALLFSRRLRGFSNLADINMDELKMGLLDSFSLEVQRSIDFFESQLKQPPIKSVQVSLPSACVEEIIQWLAEHFPLKVQLFKPGMSLTTDDNHAQWLAIAAALSLCPKEVKQ